MPFTGLLIVDAVGVFAPIFCEEHSQPPPSMGSQSTSVYVAQLFWKRVRAVLSLPFFSVLTEQ